ARAVRVSHRSVRGAAQRAREQHATLRSADRSDRGRVPEWRRSHEAEEDVFGTDQAAKDRGVYREELPPRHRSKVCVERDWTEALGPHDHRGGARAARLAERG